MATLSILQVIFLIHGVSSMCSSNNPKRFVVHPQDVNVKEGENATFTCVVSNYNKNLDSIIWYVNPTLYDQKVTLAFDEITQHMTSTLTLFNVGRKKQSHNCVLYAVDAQSVHMCHSRTGTLSVQYFPEEDDLQCGPKDQVVLDERDILQAWCNISSFDPAIMVMKWYLDDETLASGDSLINDNELYIFHKSFQSVSEFQNKILRCLFSSPVLFPEKELSCSLGPFIVNRIPTSTWSQGVPNITFKFVKMLPGREKQEESLMTSSEVIHSEFETFSEGVNTTFSNPIYDHDRAPAPTEKDSILGFVSLKSDKITSILSRHGTSGANEPDTDRMPDKLTYNPVLTITIGAVIAASVLITCLFTILIIVLCLHFRQPQRSITIEDLQELQRFTKTIPNDTVQPCQYSDQSEPTYSEPKYTDPHTIITSSPPQTACQEGRGFSDTYDSRIFDSQSSVSSRSSMRASSTYSDGVSDSEATSEDFSIHSSPDLRFDRYIPSSSVYGNQLEVDMDGPSLNKSYKRKLAGPFPAPPPLPTANV